MRVPSKHHLDIRLRAPLTTITARCEAPRPLPPPLAWTSDGMSSATACQ
eukprot:CAMPEP_0185773312 /NCGR_PEP_ID=MMETSP1174-20130828/72940_1 /TAXON_ID=35687 /ORGANISM="Dictyocha speculum, Strain CCMP1381" /LENGTH=48 /DNA_ID= /DNA_START= /DNA_END= /DNA_ORIENTATION=